MLWLIRLSALGPGGTLAVGEEGCEDGWVALELAHQGVDVRGVDHYLGVDY
jgi:hypothetical protein